MLVPTLDVRNTISKIGQIGVQTSPSFPSFDITVSAILGDKAATGHLGLKTAPDQLEAQRKSERKYRSKTVVIGQELAGVHIGLGQQQHCLKKYKSLPVLPAVMIN